MYLLYEGSMIFTRKISYIAEREETVFSEGGRNQLSVPRFLKRKNTSVRIAADRHRRSGISQNTWQAGEPHRASVDGTRRPGRCRPRIPTGSNYCGVYRDIALIRVPKCHIKAFKTRACAGQNIWTCYGESDTVGKNHSQGRKLVIEELGVSRKIQLENGAGGLF